MTSFFCADTHFQHPKIWKPREFDSLEEHDETIVQNWNNTVSDSDKVYFLGDVIFGGEKPDYSVLRRLKGKIFLIAGNHDTRLKLVEMSKIFHAVMGSFEISKKILTHIPVHDSQMDRWTHNIHGHLHDYMIFDDRYVCVSMEQIGMKPIAYEELFK